MPCFRCMCSFFLRALSSTESIVLMEVDPVTRSVVLSVVSSASAVFMKPFLFRIPHSHPIVFTTAFRVSVAVCRYKDSNVHILHATLVVLACLAHDLSNQADYFVFSVSRSFDQNICSVAACSSFHRFMFGVSFPGNMLNTAEK